MLKINVDVTDLELFEEALNILKMAYDRLDDQGKQEIETALEMSLGHTHDVNGILKGKK